MFRPRDPGALLNGDQRRADDHAGAPWASVHRRPGGFVTAANDRTVGSPTAGLGKVPTGIRGFDELTGGGLPAGRPTLVTGGAGSGKTLFGLEFLVRGAQGLDEPGVLLAFEELAPDLADNAASPGFDLPALEAEGRLVVDAVH